ncbi:MAG: SBBP repeat-containing protein [Bacteroidetes bacterium]|nr:SBBP repeat-containing protein [Bacteroidota bacterium]
MKQFALFFLIFYSNILFAQSPNLQWAKRAGSFADDQGEAVFVDTLGNVFATGSFQGTVDFDPGPSVFNLISTGDKDIFITKLDPSGNFIWAKKMGGSSTDIGQSIQVDQSGNILVTGVFMLTADFDPGSAVFNLVASNNADVFILKLDALGNFVWAKKIGGSQYDDAKSICTDLSMNIYVTGNFQGTVDMDPNAGTFNLVSTGTPSVFILKLNSAGIFVWAKLLGGANANTTAISMKIDASGNVYSFGRYSGMGDFDPGATTYTLNSSSPSNYIAKLNSAGNFVWAKSMGSSFYGAAFSLDLFGNFCITGSFSQTADFDPGAAQYLLTATGNTDIFILKLNALGDFIWAKKIGNTLSDFGANIVTDSNGDIYLTGEYESTVDFNPGAGVYNLTSVGYNDMFIEKIDSLGNFIWAISIGNTLFAYDHLYDLTVDNFGNIYSTGVFSSTVDFDPNAGISNLTSLGNYDIFIQKMSQVICLNPTTPSVTANFSSICLGDSATLSINTGVLNSATTWKWYSGSCGDTLVGSGNSIIVSPLSNTNYFVRGEGGCVLPGSCGNAIITVNALPVVTASNVNGCIGSSVLLNGMPSGGVFNLANPYSGPSSAYSYTFTNTNGCSNMSTAFVMMDTCTIYLNLKLFLEGYYMSSNTMTPTLLNQGVTSSNSITDAIIVELHNAVAPFQTLATTTTFLYTNGNASCLFSMPVGSYYIAIKHRNTVETWSTNPVFINTVPVLYNFTLSSNNAYGANMNEVEPNVWACYTGNVNTDENIDLLDVGLIENDLINYYWGYYSTDLNGDGNIDLLDMSIIDGNVQQFIFSAHP